MKKVLLPALLLVLARPGRALPHDKLQLKSAQASSAGVAPRQGIPAQHHPKPLPAHTEQLPEDITLNSICLQNNIDALSVMFQPELKSSTAEELQTQVKTVVDIPLVSHPIIFDIWLKNNKKSLIRCPLSRGGSYQIFIQTKPNHTKQLAVAPMLGSH